MAAGPGLSDDEWFTLIRPSTLSELGPEGAGAAQPLVEFAHPLCRADAGHPLDPTDARRWLDAYRELVDGRGFLAGPVCERLARACEARVGAPLGPAPRGLDHPAPWWGDPEVAGDAVDSTGLADAELLTLLRHDLTSAELAADFAPAVWAAAISSRPMAGREADAEDSLPMTVMTWSVEAITAADPSWRPGLRLRRLLVAQRHRAGPPAARALYERVIVPVL